MKRKIIIFPFSGTGKEVLDCLDNSWDCIGFISDDKNLIGDQYAGIKIYNREFINTNQDALIIAVPGSDKTFLQRERIISSLGLPLDRFAKVIHPYAKIGDCVNIGYNVVLMAGVVITANAKINNHICILPNSTIHHDSEIHDYTIICGNVLIAGNVKINKNCYIGAGSNVKNGVTIESNTLVGIGSNVIKNIESSSVVFGNPAKKHLND